MNATRADAAQSGYAHRFGWGLDGLRSLADEAAVVVVIDVLRFTSAVSAAIEAGATVLPFRWKDDRAAAYAAERDAVLAGRREDGGPSLSPTDLLGVPSGMRLVLPSPNGSTISFEAADLGVEHVLAGCLRNATATARRAHELAAGRPIAVIAGGEGWKDHDRFRPALEDFLGAGAVLAALDPDRSHSSSPDSRSARAAFIDASDDLLGALQGTASGVELTRIGFADDVETASHLDTTDLAAELLDGAFVRTPST